MRGSICFLVLSLLLIPGRADAQEILLFGGANNDEFMGSLTRRFDPDSICNRYGRYGNRFNAESIWNRFGKGSRFDPDSPWNRFGGPAMVDREGNYYGTFSIGTNTEIGRALRDLHERVDGDLDELRDLLCEAL